MDNIILNSNINKKLGYYVCDNLEFDSKIQACMHAVQVKKPVVWIFNNSIFNSYDWTVEPEHDLDYYYNLRARQIREQYDYVVLSYSGGADSHNVYEAFRRQHLHIDEIIVNNVERAGKSLLDESSSRAFDSLASEYKQQILPRLQEITKQVPKTKITIADQSDTLFQTFELAGDASWVLDKRECVHPANVTRFNYLHFNEIRKRFDKNYRIALVLGIEKPRTIIYRSELLMRFADRVANMITAAEHLKHYTNSTVEYFYWSPDCVPLLIKQGHVIKRWLENNPTQQMNWYVENSTAESYRIYQEPMLRSIIYTTWNQTWFQAEKSTFDWYSEFDQFFQVGYSDSRAYHIWKEGLNYLEKNLQPFLRKSDILNKVDGFMPALHHYNLGKIKNINPDINVWIR